MTLVGVAIAAALASRRLRPAGILAGGLAVLAVAFTVVEVRVRWNPEFVPVPGSSVELGARYWTVSSLLLWSAAVVLVGSASFDAVHRMLQLAARGLVVAWLLTLCATDFVALNPGRDGGPLWSVQVAAAARACRPGVASALVTTPPGPSWSFQVPCTLLRN